MKTVWTFDLPEDREDLEVFSNAQNYHCAIWELYNYIRDKHKYGHYAGEAAETIEEIYNDFFEILHNNDVDLFKV